MQETMWFSDHGYTRNDPNPDFGWIFLWNVWIFYQNYYQNIDKNCLTYSIHWACLHMITVAFIGHDST